jgi:hypothetical protein
MAEQEYFVRSPDGENARGPFTIEKLQSLVEAGQVDRNSLHFDDATDSWKPVGENPVLVAALFPEKKKLTLRRRGEAPPPPPPAPAAPVAKPDAPAAPAVPEVPAKGVAPSARTEGEKPAASASVPAPAEVPAAPVEEPEKGRPRLSVEDILAAAEGNTEEMVELMEQKKWRERAVALSLPMLALLMLASAAAGLYVHMEAIVDLALSGFASGWLELLEEPLAVVGMVDLFFALLLALAVTRVYPLLRLRLMLGLGYFGWMAYAAFAAGNGVGLYELAGLAAFSLGVYLSTLTLSFSFMLFCGIVAATGVGLVSVSRYFPGLFD